MTQVVTRTGSPEVASDVMGVEMSDVFVILKPQREWVTAGLAQGDHIHFTTPGYRRLGYTLFRDLMYNYEKYNKVREELARAGSNGQTSADH